MTQEQFKKAIELQNQVNAINLFLETANVTEQSTTFSMKDLVTLCKAIFSEDVVVIPKFVALDYESDFEDANIVVKNSMFFKFIEYLSTLKLKAESQFKNL